MGSLADSIGFDSCCPLLIPNTGVPEGRGMEMGSSGAATTEGSTEPRRGAAETTAGLDAASDTSWGLGGSIARSAHVRCPPCAGPVNGVAAEGILAKGNLHIKMVRAAFSHCTVTHSVFGCGCCMFCDDEAPQPRPLDTGTAVDAAAGRGTARSVDGRSK